MRVPEQLNGRTLVWCCKWFGVMSTAAGFQVSDVRGRATSRAGVRLHACVSFGL